MEVVDNRNMLVFGVLMSNYNINVGFHTNM